MDKNLFVGIMSGTSIDAIDIAVVNFEPSIKLIAKHSHVIPASVKKQILDLCYPGDNEINRMGELDNILGELFSKATINTLTAHKIKSEKIFAIGSHGQTVRHMPNSAHPFTLQIGNPALIAEMTNITTVADFRRADIAAGGQGAPLVPAFHAAIFAERPGNSIILNIGGQANITILKESIYGFDTGPGNVLLNSWIMQHHNREFDAYGEWSASADVHEPLLTSMLSDEYFLKAPPKSTGREYFNLSWVHKHLQQMQTSIDPAVVQSTLCEVTARSIFESIRKYASIDNEVLVCGGGVHNKDLMQRLSELGINARSTAAYGIDPDYMEAMAFAWLAKQALEGAPGNAIEVTGARHPVILGAIYPRLSKGT